MCIFLYNMNTLYTYTINVYRYIYILYIYRIEHTYCLYSHKKRYHDVPLIRFMTTDWSSQAPSELTFSSSQVSEATEGALSPGVEPQLPLGYNFILKHLLNQPGSSSAAISWHFESATCNNKGRSYTRRTERSMRDLRTVQSHPSMELFRS